METAYRQAIRRQVVFWLGALAVFLFILWLLGNILFPFIAGLALAYFLDPVADLLERWGLSRLVATVIILVCFVVVFVAALIIIVPILGGQIAGFLDRVPGYVSSLQEIATSLDYSWVERLREGEGELLGANAGELISQGAGWVAALLEKLWASGRALMGIVSLLLVTPVVAFYLLYDWDRLVSKVDDWLPRDHRGEIHKIVAEIDAAVAGFVRGQGTLCLVLGVLYGAALTLAGLNFGLLIGLFAGFVSFIPYVGSISGFLLSMSVALVQFWPDPVRILIIAAIFFAGQFLEGNILQPKLVGERVGLHPVWVMFALFAFGSLFGFTGLLVAVPASAAIGVLLRYAMQRYLKSELYYGQQGAGAGSSPSDLPPGHA